MKRIAPKTLLVGALITAGAIAVGFSCGKSSSDDKAAETDATKAHDVAAAGVLVSFADGSLPEGATATAGTVDAPTEFAVKDVPAASKAYDVKATAKDGTAITEALKPFTLAIDLTDAAALADVDGTQLCVVFKYDTSLFVWRNGGFTYETGKVKLTTSFFGTYQIVTCAANERTGFVLKGGDVAAKQQGAATIGATVTDAPTCDAREFEYAEGKKYGVCIEYPASFAGTAQVLASVKTQCDNMKGTFIEKGGCPTEGRVGYCQTTTSSGTGDTAVTTVSSFAYYAPNSSDDGKANCQEESADKAPSDGETKTVKYTDDKGVTSELKPAG